MKNAILVTGILLSAIVSACTTVERQHIPEVSGTIGTNGTLTFPKGDTVSWAEAQRIIFEQCGKGVNVMETTSVAGDETSLTYECR